MGRSPRSNSPISLAPRFLMGSPLCSDECRRTMCLPRHFTRSISAWFVEASDPRARSPSIVIAVAMACATTAARLIKCTGLNSSRRRMSCPFRRRKLIRHMRSPTDLRCISQETVTICAGRWPFSFCQATLPRNSGMNSPVSNKASVPRELICWPLLGQASDVEFSTWSLRGA
jgi:hypothetical protein